MTRGCAWCKLTWINICMDHGKFDRFFINTAALLAEYHERNPLDDGESAENAYVWKDDPPDPTRRFAVRSKFDCKWFIKKRGDWLWTEWKNFDFDQMNRLPQVKGLYSAYENEFALWFEDYATEVPCVLIRFLHTTVKMQSMKSFDYPEYLWKDAVVSEITRLWDLPARGFTGTATGKTVHLRGDIAGMSVKPLVQLPTRVDLMMADNGEVCIKSDQSGSWIRI